MARIELVDQTLVVADRRHLAGLIADRCRWREWWPELDLCVFMDRGLDGIRWTITGELVGSSEIWLEEVGDGVVVHYFLRADPTIAGSASVAKITPVGPRGRHQADRLRRRHALAWKKSVWALKDQLEVGRAPGESR